MRRTIGKLSYFLACSTAYLSLRRQRCPNCGGSPKGFIERKYVVTRLAECGTCYLRYRTPTDTPSANEAFYQDSYQQGFTTDCPDPEELARLLDSGFANHEKDFRRFLEIFRILAPQSSLTICDFGCSWGYGAWQFKKSGHAVIGYEISKARAQYAREKLGLRVESDLRPFAHQFDIFFSNHVLEHVPVIEDVWELAKLTLKPRGFFVATTPNGSDAHRQADPTGYSQRWGKVHPSFLTDRFLEKLFAKHPHFLASTPFSPEQLAKWDMRSQHLGQMSGSELLAVVLTDE